MLISSRGGRLGRYVVNLVHCALTLLRADRAKYQAIQVRDMPVVALLGLLAARLTERPGSSAYVAGGVVAYANEAKTELLGVEPDLLASHGAVSEPVAEAMADGALNRFGADTAIAITGIAGPGGGTDDKPVGTVCFSVRLADGETFTRTIRLPGDRSDIRERSTTVAMHLLRRALSTRPS